MQRIHEQLRRVIDVFPSTRFACVIGATGEIISHYPPAKEGSFEHLEHIGAVKRTALQFASVVRLHKCSVIRLRGLTNMITLFGFDEQFLVLMAKMDERELVEFDPSDADEKITAIVADLREAIRALLEMVYS